MSTIVLIIVIVAAVVLLGLVALAAKRRAEAKRAEQARLRRDANDHRAVADAQVSRAQSLSREVEGQWEAADEHAELARRHSEKAEEHRRNAAEIEAQKERAGKAAGFHDAQAAEREEQLK